MRILVAGGLGALGKAVAAELAARDMQVAIVDMASAEAGAASVVLGGVDLADEASVTKAYSEVTASLGGLDAVVNVAGGFIWEPVEGGSIDSWDRMYRMNLRTAAVSARAAIPHLLAGGGGSIVNVGAAAANAAAMGMAPYAASKAGVKALTESLADELRGRGIRVNAILPTIIDTPANRRDMPDADRSGWVTPGGAARAIALLISADAACITGASIVLSLPG
ncbi:SDR family NAD(P)-dependent oxidoreductase [Sphingobium phenoxybenzoativorans]|uniref:SDR family NAD(P)-dependent oxidoreductase n=1 Tax=Sphingobium phenoxybenzoativorans TaxID=1592790 RepID=A0A975Q291_9SPHN|nr:SDR family NAD(P)-dependent oxidoreductase [Sphingobium phenoxybenzoativorans]QUT06760.1 SDR family NAD(P)-dependent oxidoreductase [Sphingobium phenoxybenzoativorans]